MEIRYDKKAKKFIEAQDKPTKQRIKNGIMGLTVKPPQGDIKTMQGYSNGTYRLRVGKYRIIYRFSTETIKDTENKKQIIEILNIMDIDSRGDIYKH